MSVNAQFEDTQARSLAARMPLWAMVSACVAIDLIAVWYIAQMWDRVVPYLPVLLAGIAVVSFVARVRSVMRREE